MGSSRHCPTTWAGRTMQAGMLLSVLRAAWYRCPPGHGDIYPSLLGSNFLDSLLKEGIKYLFVSNSDNLGATLDLDLLAYFAGSGKSFLMEVGQSAGIWHTDWHRLRAQQEA